MSTVPALTSQLTMAFLCARTLVEVHAGGMWGSLSLVASDQAPSVTVFYGCTLALGQLSRVKISIKLLAGMSTTSSDRRPRAAACACKQSAATRSRHTSGRVVQLTQIYALR